MIPIIPYIPPSNDGQKPNLVGLLIASFLLIFLALGMIGIIFVKEISISSVFVILGIIMIIASVIPIIVVLESKQSNRATGRSIKYKVSPSNHLQTEWIDHSRLKYDYCSDCGSIVNRNDFFCTTCGNRIK